MDSRGSDRLLEFWSLLCWDAWDQLREDVTYVRPVNPLGMEGRGYRYLTVGLMFSNSWVRMRAPHFNAEWEAETWRVAWRNIQLRVLWKHPKSRSLGKQKPVTKGSQFKFMAPSIELCCEDLGSYWKMKMESPQSIFWGNLWCSMHAPKSHPSLGEISWWVWLPFRNKEPFTRSLLPTKALTV